MNSNRKTAIIVGVLILVAYAVLASTITESKIVVMFFEALSGVAVIGIAVLMFPFFKSFKNISLSYLGLKLIEGSLMVIGAFLFYVNKTTLRDSLYIGHTYIFIISAFIFYYLLYQTKLVPRWLSLWGIIASILLLIPNLLELTSNAVPILISVVGLSPIVLNEVVLAVWLIVKGFNEDAIKSESVKGRKLK